MKQLTRPQANQLKDSIRSWIETEHRFKPFTPEEHLLLTAFKKAIGLAHLFRPSKHRFPDWLTIYKAANWIFWLPYTQPENHFAKTGCTFNGYSRDFLTWKRALEACGLEFEYSPLAPHWDMIKKGHIVLEPNSIDLRNRFLRYLESNITDSTIINAFTKYAK